MLIVIGMVALLGLYGASVIFDRWAGRRLRAAEQEKARALLRQHKYNQSKRGPV